MMPMVFDGGWHTGGEIGVYAARNAVLLPESSGVEEGILSSASFTMTNTRTGKTYNRPDYAGSYWINGFWNDATGSLGDLDNQWNSSDLAMTATLNFYNPADAAAYAAAMTKGANSVWYPGGSYQSFSADVVGNQVIVTWN
jgi:hypothetical protein